MKKNDEIQIYDLSGNMVTYIVSNIYEASPTDTSCTYQNTNGVSIVTLLTCNNVSGKRLIVVAKPT